MKQITINHELDALFDIDPGQTVIDVPVVQATEQPVTQLKEMSTEVVVPYDPRDLEIDQELSEVKQMAVEAYEAQMISAASATDKKYSAENADVAARFLSIALDAVKVKSISKSKKDRLAHGKKDEPTTSNVTNNNIVTDRNTLIQMLRGTK